MNSGISQCSSVALWVIDPGSAVRFTVVSSENSAAGSLTQAVMDAVPGPDDIDLYGASGGTTGVIIKDRQRDPVPGWYCR